MGWLTSIIQLVELVPSFVALLQQVLSAVNSHPAGPAAGVSAVQEHLKSLPVSA